jgi:hypothetical protein
MAYTTIKKPSDYFNTVLWNGNSSAQSITGVNFQPDLVWNKSRNTAVGHRLMDSVRGVNKSLIPDDTWEEQAGEGVSSFDTDGFSFSANFGGDTNVTGQTYVAWNWLANGAGSANTDGSISSTVSANTTSGFSIVSYTGTNATATVGHGLGVTPKVVIYKNRTDVTNWYFTTTIIDGTHDLLFLNTNEAQQVYSAPVPTNSLLNLIANNDTNGSGDNIIAYCFAEVKGFSKFGSYTGNGNDANGTFVYTGFKPAFVMVKKTSGADDWQMTDHKRDVNVSPNFARLIANGSNTEATNTTWSRIDKFSNGFRLGGTDSVSNESGQTYIYMAFAEEPLVGDNPATAR